MDDLNTIKHWLTLYFLPSLGSKRLADFYHIENNPLNILANSQLFPAKAKHEYTSMLRDEQHVSWQRIQDNLDWIDLAAEQYILHINDECYPKLLKQIDDPPMLLWVKGDISILNNTQIAVVGSRACTASGIQITQQICNQLALEDILLISGGALGIDTVAHQQALKNQKKTIAVLGTGVDGFYPKQNRALFKNITQNGALISEFALNTAPSRFNFPKRNRIISALSTAVLVIEAHKKSGSLITARLALEQNKEVMAVPGSPLSAAAQGCNELIAQGAHLIQNAQDVLNVISWRNQYPKPLDIQTAHLDLEPKQKIIFNLINDVPQPIEILAFISQLEFHQVQQTLFELELKGLVTREMGGFTQG
ncbi:MAG: DNA-protecting protein DprA [Saccharospirillaceae bacterium]|nr:DNA-processing protein DprA [Pseudomonadales bacterium]NRB78826.1 DNA-protecting protein DprA [Saccharospirillaceae bacterium]